MNFAPRTSTGVEFIVQFANRASAFSRVLGF